ncbi:MAG: hypothetical protein ACRC92_20715 [Peptostreptococcaceae bacterium]
MYIELQNITGLFLNKSVTNVTVISYIPYAASQQAFMPYELRDSMGVGVIQQQVGMVSMGSGNLATQPISKEEYSNLLNQYVEYIRSYGADTIKFRNVDDLYVDYLNSCNGYVMSGVISIVTNDYVVMGLPTPPVISTTSKRVSKGNFLKLVKFLLPNIEILPSTATILYNSYMVSNGFVESTPIFNHPLLEQFGTLEQLTGYVDSLIAQTVAPALGGLPSVETLVGVVKRTIPDDFMTGYYTTMMSMHYREEIARELLAFSSALLPGYRTRLYTTLGLDNFKNIPVILDVIGNTSANVNAFGQNNVSIEDICASMNI